MLWSEVSKLTTPWNGYKVTAGWLAEARGANGREETRS